MTDRKKLKCLSRQRQLIAELFDAMGDAAHYLSEIDLVDATEGQLADCIRSFEADLRDCVECITRVERVLVQKAATEPKLGVG